jgi:hypothetical protein
MAAIVSIGGEITLLNLVVKAKIMKYSAFLDQKSRGIF